MITLEVTGYTAIALTVLMIPLAMNISMRRFLLGKAQGDVGAVSIGDAGDEILRRRIRAFGNLIEYAPMCLILLALLENTSAPANLLWGVSGLVVFGRLFHALGMLLVKNPAPRALGMAMTYAGMLIPIWGLLQY